MTLRNRILVAALWLASLFTVGAVARGQSVQPNPTPTPTVLTGPDIGFRLEGMAGNVPTGKLVIKRNGQWVEPRLTGGIQLVR